MKICRHDYCRVMVPDNTLWCAEHHQLHFPKENKMHTCTHNCSCNNPGPQPPPPPDPKLAFWMVYVNGGKSPTVRHYDYRLACAEAERLSSQLRVEVFVLKATDVCAPISQTQWKQLVS